MGAQKSNEKNLTEHKTNMDTLIIEHLAVLEINNLILQPPFQLVSNIPVGDKEMAYDGEILVYNGEKISKKNADGAVKVQVKGTTVFKKVNKKEKIKYAVKKEDISLYYQFGVGVLYFVVHINPNTLKKQAYYKMLAPLDLKKILLKLENNGNDSTRIEFKKVRVGELNRICNDFLDLVKKQPKEYIELSKQMNFSSYKVDFYDLEDTSSSLFEKSAYFYGLTKDNLEIPISVAELTEINMGDSEILNLIEEEFEITYNIIEKDKTYEVIIENTLTINILKEKGGSITLGKLKTLGSYLKCLQILNHFIIYKKLSFKTFKLEHKIDNPLKFKGFKDFKNIEEVIKNFQELITICKEIGINENYLFHSNEDLPSLFNGILSIFRDKKFNLLKISNQEALKNMQVYEIDLSDYIKVRLLFADDKFINFYSEEILTSLGGLIQKEEIPKENKEISTNWKKYYHQISIYSALDIKDMVKDANFNFDVVNLSFSELHHDIKAHQTINISLLYINYYFETNEEKYLHLAYDLNNRYLSVYPTEDAPKINIYIINFIKNKGLSRDEKNNILDIQEREKKQNSKDEILIFACEVLLGYKERAIKAFNNLENKKREELIKYPIYHMYNELI
ncbi:DUF4365 domain-containing protein [Bacillus pumilus]|uniref:DUF4365 domain-containing protein n=1 Tax=Bacillus pumilus TaxID=1408 RepID=UPI000776A4C1|nr:DUF4365 domain-containing protein [Bacillus pumilus]AMM96341.1 hypothetical protein UP12_02815 [Bacillus pumilus]MDH3150349.1 DUF4365 domain-containing protein [Bacillus pumilus]